MCQIRQKKVMLNSVSVVVTTPDHYASLPRLQSKSQSEKTQQQHSMGMDQEGIMDKEKIWICVRAGELKSECSGGPSKRSF